MPNSRARSRAAAASQVQSRSVQARPFSPIALAFAGSASSSVRRAVRAPDSLTT
jgi:hypothetical protein